MRKTLPLAVLLLVAASAHARPMQLSGEAVVRSISNNRVAVFLDTNGDQSIDRGFLLMMDIPMHNGYTAHFAKAKVEVTDGYVRVTSDKKLVDLQVAGYPDPPDPPKDAVVVTLIGSALTQSSGDSGCDVARAQEQDPGACFAYGK
ncbi:MAG TPA: hypothetical protein VJZ00_18740 [Thermoanaerobaculia bacterium]|nr:hypothetical protein [Thermoanaerobaculia bacterium]